MSELTSQIAIAIAEGRDVRHAFITSVNGTVYVGNYHKGIIEQHGILYEDRVDAGRLVGGSPAEPVVEVAVFSIDVDIPPEQEDRTITMTTLKTLVSSNKTPIPIRERHT